MRTELDPDLPQVLAERVQLQQVFMNLMLKRIDAMKDTSGANELIITSEADSAHLVISVSDTGAGLLPEHVDQISTPSLRPKIMASAWDFRSARSIVESHGGRLVGHGPLRTRRHLSVQPACHPRGTRRQSQKLLYERSHTKR